MAKNLWVTGSYAQEGAVAELMAHGNVRQAAVLVKELVEKYPVCEGGLRTSFKGLVDDFITQSPDVFPSKPEEYPDIIVRYDSPSHG